MIRCATLKDLPALVDLAIEALLVDPYTQLVISRERVEEAVRLCITQPANFGWVAEDKNGIYGALGAFVLPFLMYERYQCQIAIWYCRRPGDGLRLLREFKRWLTPRILIKQVLYEMAPNADPRIRTILQRFGFGEVLPTLAMTR